MMRSLQEILQSTSKILFPAELGRLAVSMDSRDCDGDLPLHVQLWRKDIEAVKVLIAAGADVNAIGDMGETPLHIAVMQEDLESAKALVQAGARLDIRSEFGVTAGERAMAIGGEFVELGSK